MVTITFNFSMSNMLDYFINRNAVDGNPNSDFKNMNTRAFPLFKAGHIQCVIYKRYNDKMLVKCKCHAEMKKNQLYLMRAVFNTTSDIVFAVCGCVAGAGPTCSCKHFGALCYFLEEFCRLTIQTSYTSCTSSLQTWHQPRKRPSSSTSTLSAIKFVKDEHGKDKKIISSNNYDPRPLACRGTSTSEIVRLQQQLERLPNPVAFSHILSEHVIIAETSSTIHQLPLIPRSSQIRIQKAVMDEPQPISLNSLRKHGKAFLDMITISHESISKIEVATRKQSQSPRWYHERHCRITSSNFGLCCKGNVTTSKIKALLYHDETSKISNSAILWGRLHETTAFEQYESSMCSSDQMLSKSGILISNDGFLAASPDGTVSTANGERSGLIEIKCPYSSGFYTGF